MAFRRIHFDYFGHPGRPARSCLRLFPVLLFLETSALNLPGWWTQALLSESAGFGIGFQSRLKILFRNFYQLDGQSIFFGQKLKGVCTSISSISTTPILNVCPSFSSGQTHISCGLHRNQTYDVRRYLQSPNRFPPEILLAVFSFLSFGHVKVRKLGLINRLLKDISFSWRLTTGGT